jgi:LAS superfamily LD-carboxypeptidase LdcB
MQNLEKLLTEAYNAGIYLKVNSAYRDYDDQVRIKDESGADAATPGRSNHGFGLAVDFAAGPGARKLTTKDNQYKWLLANAGKYGFKRLPWGIKGEDWEAWHWEYQI